MQPEDPMEEAFVRLTVLEFVLEVMLANTLADVAQDTSALAKRDLVLRIATARPNEQGEAAIHDQATRIADRLSEVMLHFVEKVRGREIEIRAKRT
jgi:hypothetical protein